MSSPRLAWPGKEEGLAGTVQPLGGGPEAHWRAPKAPLQGDGSDVGDIRGRPSFFLLWGPFCTGGWRRKSRPGGQAGLRSGPGRDVAGGTFRMEEVGCCGLGARASLAVEAPCTGAVLVAGAVAAPTTWLGPRVGGKTSWTPCSMVGGGQTKD